MKKSAIFLIILLLSVSVQVFAADDDQKKGPVFHNDHDKMCYAVGLEIGESFKSLGAKMNTAFLVRGVEDSLKGNKPLLTASEIAAVKQAFMQKAKAAFEKKDKILAKKNKEEGEKFLAENKKKKGIVTTASGLQYKIIKQGTGPTPKETDKVKVHYRGKLLDGTEFDSSYSRGTPFEFPVKGMVPGWIEALQLMKVGSKYELFIAPNLAYGERRMGRQIGPNATLVFEIELLEILK